MVSATCQRDSNSDDLFVCKTKFVRARGVVGYHARLAIDMREGSGSIPDVSIFFLSTSTLTICASALTTDQDIIRLNFTNHLCECQT